MVSFGERYFASLSPLRHFQLPEVVGRGSLGSWHRCAQDLLWTLSNAFVEKGFGRLGLVLATVVPLHRPPIGQGRHRNGC